MHLGKKGQFVLRILHLAAVSCWFGSVLCVLLLMHEAPLAGSDDDLFGMLRASAVINQYVLVPAGAFGTFFTGLTFSLCTSRGFVKYPWVACKWLIAASLLVVGTLFLIPWAGQELDDVCRNGLAAYIRPDVMARHARRELYCALYAALLGLALTLAVLKPGERQG